MDLVLLISILIRIVALVWSVWLLRKLREWRLAFLTLMLALMAARQILTTLNSFDGWTITVSTHLDEIPGLLVSILALIIVILLGPIIYNRKRTNESLHDTTSLLKLYKDYFDAATNGMFVFDENIKLVNVNNEACRMHGYTREEMLQLKPTDYIHPDSLHHFDAYINTTREGKVFHTVAQGIHKDGSIIDVEVRGIMAYADKKKYYIASLRDVTEMVNAKKALEDSEDKYRNIVETTNEWIWEVDMDGKYSYSNNAVLEILGYMPQEIIGQNSFKFIHPDEIPYVKEMFVDCINTRMGWSEYIIAWKHKEGSIKYLESNATPILDKKGELIGYRGVDRDITERRKMDELLRLSEARYRTLYNDNPSMFFTLDEKGKILSVNKYGAEQLGYSTRELIGRNVTTLFYTQDKANALQFLEACIQKPDEVHRWECRKTRKDGSMLWVRETARLVRDSDNNINIFIVCEDFSDTRLLSEQLSYQASHDALTGLINRREFEIRLNRILETVRIDMAQHALCYLDLDQFKVINDACGHIAGDELLHQISQVLKKRIRKLDTLARLGGDEFGILMEHCTMEQASKVAEDILREIGQYRFEWEGRSYGVGVSIGLVPIDDSIVNKTEALREADAACYAAKEAGRNRVHVYSSDDIELARRHGEIQWVARINLALEKDLFVLYGQPIISIKSEDTQARHYEILIRMKSEGNEIIAPGAFLPAAERYNLATRIDRWVVDNTLEFLNNNEDFLHKIDIFSINLSGKSLADDGFLDFLMDRINHSDGLAKKICFEITETAVIANLMRASLFIRRLKELGCRFSLDDFGSGLSSFAYLKTLPVDFLKIDGLFVKDIVKDETDYAMVKSINDIGQVMGIETIAEFVENESIRLKLVNIGVDYAQGYGIGRPKSLAEIGRSNNNKPRRRVS